MSDWVKAHESSDGSTLVENREGVAWLDAPMPSRFHRCAAQTRGWTGYFNQVFRCACGAISSDGRRWSERNSRRDGPRLRRDYV